MKKRNPVLIGAVFLTASGLITRLIGFFYRIFLSNLLGAEGLGLYHLIFPVYGICFSLCCGPIQTAISRFVAAESEHPGSAHRRYFYGGVFLSVSLSMVFSGSIYAGSGLLADYVLSEPRAAFLLQILALSIPFAAIHGCAVGYYYGIKKAGIPALSQLLEQVVRVLAVWIFVETAAQAGIAPSPAMAVGGMVTGEAVSALFVLAALSGRFAGQRQDAKKAALQASEPQKASSGATPPVTLRSCVSQIFFWALPLSTTRLCLSLLQSGESILIPLTLRRFGLTNSEALSLYGIFTGMAMPFIMFPSALTNSLSVMLLPDMAEQQSAGRKEQIRRTTGRVVTFSLYIGILFSGLFLAYGKELGLAVFQNETAGSFITTLAWLCPFLYLSTTLGSILNGLGYTKATFRHNLAGMAGCLCFIGFLVPRFGFQAVLWGNLADQLIVSGLHLRRVRKEIPFPFSPIHQLFRPLFSLLAGLAAAHLLFTALAPYLTALPGLLLLGGKGLITVLCYLALLAFTKNG